jgi:hypothetical protein
MNLRLIELTSTTALDYRTLLTELAGLGDADLPLLLEHLPRAEYPPAAAFIREQAAALGFIS